MTATSRAGKQTETTRAVPCAKVTPTGSDPSARIDWSDHSAIGRPRERGRATKRRHTRFRRRGCGTAERPTVRCWRIRCTVPRTTYPRRCGVRRRASGGAAGAAGRECSPAVDAVGRCRWCCCYHWDAEDAAAAVVVRLSTETVGRVDARPEKESAFVCVSGENASATATARTQQQQQPLGTTTSWSIRSPAESCALLAPSSLSFAVVVVSLAAGGAVAAAAVVVAAAEDGGCVVVVCGSVEGDTCVSNRWAERWPRGEGDAERGADGASAPGAIGRAVRQRSDWHRRGWRME